MAQMIFNTLLACLVLQSPTELNTTLEAPFKATEHAIIVDCVVNGKNISFMFDTGFGGWFVINDQINIGKPSGTMNLRDFVGTFQASTVAIETVQLGQLKIPKPNADAVQQPVAHFTDSYGTHTDGIMGFSVVKDYITEINFEKQKFIFHPRTMDITKRTPDNKKTFLVKMEPSGFNSIELKTEVNGKPVHLALDTGNAFYATTHKEVLERVGLWNPNDKPKFMSKSYVASGPVDSFSMFVPDAIIYGVPVKNSVWDIIDLPSSSVEHDGTVGYQFLKHFNIIIDYHRRYVWLENFTGKVMDEHKGSPGLRVTHRNGAYVIWHVIGDSPAEMAGIKIGDRLMAVDGKTLTTVRPEDVDGLLEGPVGSTAKLVISRQGSIQRLEVPRKLLVNGAHNESETGKR